MKEKQTNKQARFHFYILVGIQKLKKSNHEKISLPEILSGTIYLKLYYSGNNTSYCLIRTGGLSHGVKNYVYDCLFYLYSSKIITGIWFLAIILRI